MAARRLILASASPRRRELIASLGIDYEIHPSAYEEQMPAEHAAPGELVAALATEKARDVAKSCPNEWVLGADTIVVLDGRLYGKPADPADARRMLRELSGRTHQVWTGLCVLAPDGTPHTRSVMTDVSFRPLDETEITAYVATGEPLDKAGSYAIQGYGAILIDRIDGNYTNVVGLPLTSLALLLRQLGFTILGVGEA